MANLKATFTAERFRHFDILQAKEAGWLFRKGERVFQLPGYQQIKCIEAKLTTVRQDMEAPEHMKRSYNSMFKGTHKQHINKRRKNANRRKLNERKRKRTENNVQRVYGICVGKPLGNLP